MKNNFTDQVYERVQSKMMKRGGPDPVKPIVIGDIRFEAVHWGDDIGCNQDGGYIVAIDDSSSKQLWTLKVYQTSYKDELERDVQDVFITKLTAVEENKRLAVENEHGNRYIVDIETKTVTSG